MVLILQYVLFHSSWRYRICWCRLTLGIFSRNIDLTTSIVCPSVCPSVRHQNPWIINKSSFISCSSVVYQSFISCSSVVHQLFISCASTFISRSPINFIINQLYSSLAQLIATFKHFSLVSSSWQSWIKAGGNSKITKRF